MDGQRFDDLTKNLSTAARSRRGVVRGLVGGAVGAFLGGVTLKGAAAESVDATDAICDRREVLCNSRGEPAFVCGDGCVCARNVTNGDKQCVEAFRAICTNRQRCNENGDCDGRGEVCIRVSGCTDEDCSRGRGRCFNRCRP